MSIDLYHSPASGPCRTVRMVAAAIGVDLNLKYCDLTKGDQYKSEFLKMNPQHSVPVLDDDGFYLVESRAISTYLIDKYAKDDSLYPKDLQKRAVVNQRLYFDVLNLYQPLFDHYKAETYYGVKKDPSELKELNEAFEYLDKFLEGEHYVAGDHLTVADITIASTVSNMPIFNYDFGKYKNVVRWFSRIKTEIPKYEEINEAGLEEFRQLLNHIKNRKK